MHVRIDALSHLTYLITPYGHILLPVKSMAKFTLATVRSGLAFHFTWRIFSTPISCLFKILKMKSSR